MAASEWLSLTVRERALSTLTAVFSKMSAGDSSSLASSSHPADSARLRGGLAIVPHTPLSAGSDVENSCFGDMALGVDPHTVLPQTSGLDESAAPANLGGDTATGETAVGLE